MLQTTNQGRVLQEQINESNHVKTWPILVWFSHEVLVLDNLKLQLANA